MTGKDALCYTTSTQTLRVLNSIKLEPMRSLSSFEQEDRKRKLLQAIIHEYIKTAKPVGSAFLADKYKMDLSSATIRHVMAELEAEGYLTHPHTSAGRVPTDKAYRLYVDSLVDLQRLALMEEERIRREHEERTRQIEDLMLATSKTLSALSKFSGFVISPPLDQARLRHLELIPLDGNRVLAVLVSDTGVVKHRAIQFTRHYPLELLKPLAAMLNENLRGRTFSDVRDNIKDHIEFLGQRQMDMLQMSQDITREAFQMDQNDIYLEGAGSLLSLPDFSDYEQMRSVANLLDEKSLIGEVLTRHWSEEPRGRWRDVQVKIGAETKIPAFKNLSMVSATYKVHDRTVGVLGIIGPKRMEYSRMMGLVSFVAKSVSKVLNKLVGGQNE